MGRKDSRDRGRKDSRDRGRRSPSRRRRSPPRRSPPRRRQRSPTPRRGDSRGRDRRRSPSRRAVPQSTRSRERSAARQARERSRSRKKVRYEVGMRVEARDTGKSWNPGTVTCVKPLRVKLDSELSGCGWDEVRPLTHEPEKPKTGVDLIKQKIMEDAQALVSAAKEEALAELKKAVEGFRDISSQEVPDPEALKEAKLKVAAAIKEAQAKGVSPEELIEASSQMNVTKQASEEPKKGGESEKEERVKKEKVKKEKVAIEFTNPAVGEAAREAAEKAKEEGKPLPEMIKAAITALQTVGGAGPEDIKKVKKLAAEIALDQSSSSSSDSSDTELEREIDKDEKAKAKREGIAAAFYFNAK